MQIGDILSFGSYKWRVLDIQNDTALIITEEIIEQRPYHDRYVDITWADCELRKYLNGEFYDKPESVQKTTKNCNTRPFIPKIESSPS
jgi:hypothetical protein